VKVDIVLVLVDLCRIMRVVVSALNTRTIGIQEGCKLDFGLDLQSKTQGKFLDHTLQLIVPFICFRNFFSYASLFYSKPFVVFLQILFILLLQGGFKGDLTLLTMFSTIMDFILFGFLGLCLHCTFFYSICSMLQSCPFLCKKV
jgi:hypothetical protein